MAIKYQGIGHCAFSTGNYERSLDFYCNKLGFINEYSLYNEDGSVWLTYLRFKDSYVELFPVKGNPARLEGQAYHHMCLLVEDIEAAANELHSKGVTIWNGPSFLGLKAEIPFKASPVKCGSYAFYIDDPDGNYIEIMQYTENSRQLDYKRREK